MRGECLAGAGTVYVSTEMIEQDLFSVAERLLKEWRVAQKRVDKLAFSCPPTATAVSAGAEKCD